MSQFYLDGIVKKLILKDGEERPFTNSERIVSALTSGGLSGIVTSAPPNAPRGKHLTTLFGPPSMLFCPNRRSHRWAGWGRKPAPQQLPMRSSSRNSMHLLPLVFNLGVRSD